MKIIELFSGVGGFSGLDFKKLNTEFIIYIYLDILHIRQIA
jgi:site-specific DNA-cytosine methylase